MELTQDKIDLIEQIIKNDRKFTNNEDLYDDFFNETCRRSFVIVNSITSDETLKSYLRKVAATSILNVLKSEGRLRRAGNKFVKNTEVPLYTEQSKSFEINYSSVVVSYEPVDIKDTPEDLAVKKEILQKIIDTVNDIDQEFPEKAYLKLYYMRYEKGMTQNEIAQELTISQSEVSKRLFKLMDKVKQAFN